LIVAVLQIPDMSPAAMIWTVAALSAAGVILRPFNFAEAVWAVAGAALLVALGLISIPEALTGVGKGTDVYLFLFGMMLLAEIARQVGLFDWLAAVATSRAKGSARRLFLLTYGVGMVVTILLSNDATAVVLTPAVAAAARAAKARQPLPYLLICAFIANAASFVLPISNPANLVIYGSRMPPLLHWLPAYLLPSLVSIVATYLLLHWTQRGALQQEIAKDIPRPALSGSGRMAAVGIAATAVVLLASSAFGVQLGLPTAVAGALTAAIVLVREKKWPWSIVKDISWGVLPLVAGLFVLVEALAKTGLIDTIATLLHDGAQRSALWTAGSAGIAVALASNLINNLPAGLIAGSAIQAVPISDQITRAMLIGVDLGPNLSVSGSLATILWLAALRREGRSIGFGAFLKIGIVVMPPALILAIAGALLLPG
jgi:arsenical pump membrane protein